MAKDSKIYIDHIFESIILLEEYLSGVDELTFKSSKLYQDLACRRLEIIGEAVKNIPEEIRENYSLIKWKSIAGLRDVLIHHYFGIDLALLWNVIQKELPELKTKLLDMYKYENWKCPEF